MSELESEHLCVGGPCDGQSLLVRKEQAAWQLFDEHGRAAWYRADPADPTRAIYAGPEFDGMDAGEFESTETFVEEMSPWIEEQEHDGE